MRVIKEEQAIMLREEITKLKKKQEAKAERDKSLPDGIHSMLANAKRNAYLDCLQLIISLLDVIEVADQSEVKKNY